MPVKIVSFEPWSEDEFNALRRQKAWSCPPSCGSPSNSKILNVLKILVRDKDYLRRGVWERHKKPFPFSPWPSENIF